MKKKLLVLYYIENPNKDNDWTDGFTSAMDIVAKEHHVTWMNLFLHKPNRKQLAPYDFIIVKSNWNWVVDNYIRKKIMYASPKKAIMVSGSLPPPTFGKWYYDVIYYETEWYREKYLGNTGKAFHAFGIDTDIMAKREAPSPKEYDWISVGKLKDYKRHLNLLDKPGKKIVIGDMDQNKESQDIYEKLKAGKVEVLPFMHYSKLVEYYWKSKNAYIGCELQGGGERFLLESRACGLKVHIEPDNPKLQSLMNSPIYDHHYYAQQLLKGMWFALGRQQSQQNY